MKIDEVNSNLAFVLIVLASFYKSEWIYFILAVSILIASSCYHISKVSSKSSSLVKRLRYLDILVASAGYVYVFYFIYAYIEGYQILSYTLLIVTIIMFFIGKNKFGIKNNMHSYFHIAVGIVPSVIVLLK